MLYENTSLTVTSDAAVDSCNREFYKSGFETLLDPHSINTLYHRQPYGLRSPAEPWTTPEAESTMYGDLHVIRPLFVSKGDSPARLPLGYGEEQHWSAEVKSEPEYKELSELTVPQWFNLHYITPSNKEQTRGDIGVKMDDHISRWLREQTCDEAVKRKRRVTKNQRLAANERERRRMDSLNVAFENLRAIIPVSTNQRRLSRIQTLRFAIDYISLMTEILNSDRANLSDKYCDEMALQRVVTSSVISGKTSSTESRKFRNRRRISKRK